MKRRKNSVKYKKNNKIKQSKKMQYIMLFKVVIAAFNFHTTQMLNQSPKLVKNTRKCKNISNTIYSLCTKY